MSVLQRYFASEIMRAVLFVLLAFLAFFSIFELPAELQLVGRGGYGLQHAFLYVLLGVPGNAYLLMPIAALIGTIYTLAQMAAHSEFTIMRVSSMSTAAAAWMLTKIGLVFAVATLLLGEYVAPFSTQQADRMKWRAQDIALVQEFRSGLWTKDVIKDVSAKGAVIGSRFLNVREVRPDGQLLGVKMYEFNRDFRLTAIVSAVRADYLGRKIWRLSDVSETIFSIRNSDAKQKAAGSGTQATNLLQKNFFQDFTDPAAIKKSIGKEFVSEITPSILSVLFTDPDRMSAVDLALYTRHLTENNQDAARYQIAFWKKVIYPFAVLVMMALALPFAYLHVRSGAVSLKIFAGIMIGVSFQLLNSLFSHIGILNTWPPFATAAAPSILFLLMAIGALWWVERH